MNFCPGCSQWYSGDPLQHPCAVRNTAGTSTEQAIPETRGTITWKPRKGTLGWIKISERGSTRPKITTRRIIFFIPGEGILVGELIEDGILFAPEGSCYRVEDVTHWMEVDPPEDV